MGDFLQFNPDKNNQLSDVDYAASSYREDGAEAGVAPANVHNKLFYQLSTMVKALADAFVAKGYTVSDAVLADLTTVLGNIVTQADISADTTTGNATSGHHGLLPKLSGNAAYVLRGDGSYGYPSYATAAGSAASATVATAASYQSKDSLTGYSQAATYNCDLSLSVLAGDVWIVSAFGYAQGITSDTLMTLSRFSGPSLWEGMGGGQLTMPYGVSVIQGSLFCFVSPCTSGTLVLRNTIGNTGGSNYLNWIRAILLRRS